MVIKLAGFVYYDGVIADVSLASFTYYNLRIL